MIGQGATLDWRDIVAVLGVVVSLGGFSIAITQVVRARRASEAAERAVRTTVIVLARNLAIADVVRASERIEDIKRLHRERQWQQALERYRDIRLVLAEIRSRHPSLTAIENASLQDASDQMRTIERSVGRATSGGSEPTQTQRFDDFLLDTQIMLDELASNLQQTVSPEVAP